MSRIQADVTRSGLPSALKSLAAMPPLSDVEYWVYGAKEYDTGAAKSRLGTVLGSSGSSRKGQRRPRRGSRDGL